jgi:hypothetical protein
MSARTIIEKSCGTLNQKTALLSARPKGPRCRRKFLGAVLAGGKKTTASGGSRTSNRVGGEGWEAYSTTRPLYVLNGHKIRVIWTLDYTYFRIVFAVRRVDFTCRAGSR